MYLQTPDSRRVGEIYIFKIISNLSFDELKALTDSVAEKSLLEQISGGTANDCHDFIPEIPGPMPIVNTAISA